MSQPQEDLSQSIRDLERSRRRWKGLALGMLALLAVFLVVGAGLVQTARVRAERARAVEAEMLAREKMLRAEAERDRAEQLRRQAGEGAEKGKKP